MKNVHLPDNTQDADKSPSGWSIIWRELVRDKLAFISLIFLVLIMVFVYGISLFLDQNEIVKVDLFSIHKASFRGILVRNRLWGTRCFWTTDYRDT